jgi:hypothetical protein
MASKSGVAAAADRVMDTIFEKGSDTELTSLEGSELLEETSLTVKAHAVGDSYEDAVNGLFKAMRQEIFAEAEGPVIQMNAESVVFNHIAKNEFTEHFLGVFMPRQRVRYDITASIKVLVKYIKREKGEE